MVTQLMVSTFSMTDEISQAIVRNVFVWSNALDQTCVILKNNKQKCKDRHLEKERLSRSIDMQDGALSSMHRIR